MVDWLWYLIKDTLWKFAFAERLYLGKLDEIERNGEVWMETRWNRWLEIVDEKKAEQ